MNEGIIKNSLRYAKSKLFFDCEPLLIPPKETGIELDQDEIGGRRELYDKERKKLPDIVCLSGWDSYTHTKDGWGMASYLTIVWFQDELAMPIDDHIIEQIKNIDWENKAVDYEI